MKTRCAWGFAGTVSVWMVAGAIGCGGSQQADAIDASPNDSFGDDGVDASSDDEGDEDASSTSDPPDASDGVAIVEASAPEIDAGARCIRPPMLGDLVIDELMIASLKGSGDHGEWIEVASTASCAMSLRGFHAEAPRGGKVSTLDVLDDVWIPAHGTFVIADSVDPAVMHYIPGIVIAWSGDAGDVLRNEGTTVSLLIDGTLIDSVTYPSLPTTVGAALAFPSDCPAGARTDFARWRTATSSWFPGFLGTPNAPNSDVVCAAM